MQRQSETEGLEAPCKVTDVHLWEGLAELESDVQSGGVAHDTATQGEWSSTHRLTSSSFPSIPSGRGFLGQGHSRSGRLCSQHAGLCAGHLQRHPLIRQKWAPLTHWVFLSPVSHY